MAVGLALSIACGSAGRSPAGELPGQPDAGAPADAGTTGAGGPGADTLPLRRSPIADENQLRGGRGHRLESPTGDLAAYADRTSALPGEDVFIHAGAAAATSASWELWRVGYYGGAGGRKIAEGGPVAVPQWTAAVLDPATGAVCANWPSTFRVGVPADAVTGVYLVKLSTKLGQTYATFIVREAAKAAGILYPVSTNTYQAYNGWGGTGLYTNKRSDWGSWHAYAVCFDRPYEQNHGAGELVDKDRDFITFAEAQGYDIAYVSDADLDREPDLVARRRMVLIQGHSEYWTAAMRDAVEGAIAAGTNTAFLAANSAYWQVRYTDPARRMMLGYKEFAALDPARSSDPAHLTTRWRDPPLNRPESRMVGEMFGAWLWVAAPLRVLDPSSWVWTGAGVDEHTTIPGIYADEVDSRAEPKNEPSQVGVLSGALVESHDGAFSVGETTLYTAPSGARVFSSGSINWSHALAGARQWDVHAQQATANLFAVFAGDGTLPAQMQPMQLPPGAPAPALRAGVQVATVTDGLSMPAAVAAAPGGDAIVADGNRILRVTPSGAVTLVAGGDAGMADGPCGSARFLRPRGLAVAADGTIYVADTGNNRIRVISAGSVRTLAGSGLGFADGAGSAALFAQPMGLALTAAGTLLVADAWNQRVREVRGDGMVSTWAGSGARSFQDGPGASASFTFPISVAVMPGESALVVEPESGMLRAVSSGAAHEVARIAGSLGGMGWQDGPLGTATLAEVIAAAVRPGGEIVLLDGATGRVRALRNGVVDTLATGFGFPRALAVAADGSVLVVDAADHALRRIVIP